MMKENGRKPNSACHQEHVQVLNSLTDTLKDELKRGLTLLDNCVNQLAQAKWILINVERTIEDFYADCPACDVKSKTGNSAVTPPSASGAPANSASTPALNSSSTTQSSSGGAGARKSTGGSKAAKKASVLPMVSGHTVQRPKINIARVDSNKSKKSKQRTERDTVSASRVRSRGSGSSALATITASASAGISIDDSADELAAGPSQSAAAAEPGTSQTPQRKKNKPGPLSKTRVTNSNSGGETAGKRDFSCDGADISVDLDDIGYLLSGKTFFKGSELYKFPQIILEAAPAGSSSKPETAESKTKIKSDTPTTTESAKKRKLTLSSDSDEEPLENLKKKSTTVSSTKTATKVATPEAGSSSATASPKVPLKPKLPSALFAKLGQSLLTKLKTGTAKLPGKSPSTPAPPSESGSTKDDEKKVVSVKKEVVKHEKEDNDKNKNIKDDDNSDSPSDSNSKTKANDSKKLPNKSSDESEAEIIPSKIDRRTKPADRHKIQNSKNENDSGDESETEVLPSKNRGSASVNKKGVGGKKTNKGKSSDDSDDPEFIVSPSKKSRSRSSAGPKSKQQPQPSASSKIKSRATVSSGDESNDSDNDSNTSARQRNKSGGKKSTKAAATSRVNSSSKSLEVENENDSKSNAKSSPTTESVETEADKENPVDLEDDNKSSASVEPVPARPKPGPASAKAKRTGGRPGPMSAKLKLQEQNDSSAMDVDGSDNGKDKDNVTTTNSINFSTKIFTDSDSDSSELAKIKKKIPLDLQDAVRSPSPNRPNSSDIFGKLLGTYKSTNNTARADTQEAPSTPLQNLKIKVGRETNSEIFILEERVREKLSSVGRELVPYSGPIEMSDDIFSPGNYYVLGKHNEEKLVFCDESSELQELDLSSGDIDELMNID